MKRDPKLRILSSDHHHALVLARFIQAMCVRDSVDDDAIAFVKERFGAEIAPHFAIEEQLLAPLEGRGVDHLVTRTREDHAAMLRLLDAVVPHDTSTLHELGELIAAHVSFEQRELYPACEEHLPRALLEAVARAQAGHHEG